MNTEPILASVGEFCPNAECGLYQQLDRGNIVKFGKTQNNKSIQIHLIALRLPGNDKLARFCILLSLYTIHIDATRQFSRIPLKLMPAGSHVLIS